MTACTNIYEIKKKLQFIRVIMFHYSARYSLAFIPFYQDDSIPEIVK